MLIDHIGYVLFPNILILRIIGRLSFPLFAFLIAEGYHYTRSVDKYMLRLFVFALISEIPFDLAFHGELLEFHGQNIFFTLLLGLIAIKSYDYLRDKNIALAVISVFATCLISFYFKTDYYVFGVLIIFAFNKLRNAPKGKLVVNAILLLLLTSVIALSKGEFTLLSTYQLFSIISLGLIYLYNGQSGKKLNNLKYVFYSFYPVHLLVIYLIRIMSIFTPIK